MKNLKKNSKFVSQQSNARIKVLHIIKSVDGDHKHDLVTIANLSSKDRPLKKTVRIVYSDSIRRRYFQQ